jgi:hypothetical protein
MIQPKETLEREYLLELLLRPYRPNGFAQSVEPLKRSSNRPNFASCFTLLFLLELG